MVCLMCIFVYKFITDILNLIVMCTLVSLISCLIYMNKLFLPTSRKILPTFQTFCPDGVQIAQRTFILPTFKFRPGKGGFWVGLWVFLYTQVYISLKGMCDG